jgi:hypothetical protein
VLGIFGARALDILLPALLHHLQPAAQVDRQHREAIGHHVGQHPRALAAAGDEHAEHAILEQRGIILAAQRQHLVAHRVADQMHAVLELRVQPVDLLVGGGDRVDPARHEAVDPAQHRVLFVDDRGDARLLRREQRRQRRVSAKADHRAGLEILEQVERHGAARPDALDAAEPADRPARDASGRQDMHLVALENTGNLRAALVGHQRDMVPALLQLARERIGRNQMSAGAACGEHIMARDGHQFFQSDPSRLRSSNGLRRVSDSSNPAPMPSAIIDEPP